MEADELYQNAGEKGIPHIRRKDPPRRRANQRKGHGTFATDRPAVVGVVGRQSHQLQLQVVRTSSRASLEPAVLQRTQEGATVNTDQWPPYEPFLRTGRVHKTVNHGRREWARDDDGDHVREVHINTIEGIWTGVRNFLRTFRGVSKHHLAGYLAVFMATYNFKDLGFVVVRLLAGLTR